MSEGPSGFKMLALRRPAVCVQCATGLPVGTSAGWHAATKSVACTGCLARHPLADRSPDPGTPGAAAQAEYERRRKRREERVRAAHPRLGGVILALTDEPQSTRAWKSGAEGEQQVARRLAKLADDTVSLLHDRRMPRGGGNIDHIAIGPSGVFVIDAKRYVGKKVEVRREGGIFRPRTERLFVGGRDKTQLLDGVAKQVDGVRATIAHLDGWSETPVSAILCFIDAELPPFGSVTVHGVPCIGPRRTAKRISEPGPYQSQHRDLLFRHLAAALPPR